MKSTPWARAVSSRPDDAGGAGPREHRRSTASSPTADDGRIGKWIGVGRHGADVDPELETHRSSQDASKESTMAIGPVEYMVVAFPGNQFKGEIAPALKELIDTKTIRVIDLAFVMKDADGNVAGVELEDAGSAVFEAFHNLTIERGGLINDDDMMDIGEALDANSAAAILVWEDLWATRFAEAVRGAGGVLVDIQRIPHEIVQAAVDYAAAS
jgi:uncharacterized membrane protein